jgi:hypothetical protein
MRATDKKAAMVPDNYRRALTIHDGARLTPALVAVLSSLSEHAEVLIIDRTSERLAEHHNASAYQRNSAAAEVRSSTRPVLIARADGLAVYCPRRLL